MKILKLCFDILFSFLEKLPLAAELHGVSACLARLDGVVERLADGFNRLSSANAALAARFDDTGARHREFREALALCHEDPWPAGGHCDEQLARPQPPVFEPCALTGEHAAPHMHCGSMRSPTHPC